MRRRQGPVEAGRAAPERRRDCLKRDLQVGGAAPPHGSPMADVGHLSRPMLLV